MSPKLYLFLPARSDEFNTLNAAVLNWVYEDTSNELILTQGLLSDVKKIATNHQITVVLPGEDVLFLTAEVPGNNIKRIQQAVPYVLEDSVIDDVDNLYFAIKKSALSDSGSQYDVSVINKQYFDALVNQLESAGIQADSMTADYWLLPDNNTLLNDNERVIFNGPDLKFSVPLVGITALGDYGLTGGQTINVIDCESKTGGNSNIEQLTDDLNVEKLNCGLHPLLCLIKYNVSEKGINLLQGKYKKKKNWSQAVNKWLPAAALFLLWLSVQGVVFIFDYISLSKQNEKLNAEIVKIYKMTFPGSHRIVDAKAQMKQKLADIKKRKGLSGRSFSEMLSSSALVFSKSNGLKIKTLRYYDGRINVELQITSLQALDNLKNELTNTVGYQVEIQNASSGKENVTARLQIKGAEL